jgi:general secretion pathway protein D
MQIYQEQSSVKSTTAAGTSNAGPSTTKRSIEGTVTVDDGQILVLGGLIEDTYTDAAARCRCWATSRCWARLFRSESRERKRTNLMVFLRPIVMRDADAQRASRWTATSRSAAARWGAQPRPEPWCCRSESPVLPPQAPRPAAPDRALRAAGTGAAADARRPPDPAR